MRLHYTLLGSVTTVTDGLAGVDDDLLIGVYDSQVLIRAGEHAILVV
ncbi:MAG: hypothetical protein ACJA1H_000981 [Glaciecola sp.]